MSLLNGVGLPDFSNIAKNIATPQNLIGAAGGMFFDKGLAARTPSPKVLASSAKIYIQHVSDFTPVTIELGDLDRFSARKSFNVIKRWKPYGYKTEQVLTEDVGWDLSFGGNKSDWRAAFLFYLNEYALHGNTQSNATGAGKTFANTGSVYMRPIYEIRQDITHYDGTIETYIYKDVILLDYDITIDGNNDVIPENFTAFSAWRALDENFRNLEANKMIGVVRDILNVISTNRSI